MLTCSGTVDRQKQFKCSKKNVHTSYDVASREREREMKMRKKPSLQFRTYFGNSYLSV